MRCSQNCANAYYMRQDGACSMEGLPFACCTGRSQVAARLISIALLGMGLLSVPRFWHTLHMTQVIISCCGGALFAKTPVGASWSWQPDLTETAFSPEALQRLCLPLSRFPAGCICRHRTQPGAGQDSALHVHARHLSLSAADVSLAVLPPFDKIKAHWPGRT